MKECYHQQDLADAALGLSAVGDLTPREFRELADGPVVGRLAKAIIVQAIEEQASHIHIEPGAAKVRCRVDGQMRDASPLPIHIQPLVVARLKSMAGLDLGGDTHSRADRIRFDHDGREFDLHMSTLPTVLGENLVVRVRYKMTFQLGFNKLGFYDQNLLRWSALTERARGLVLVTGPADSGKLTTLSCSLNRLKKPERSLTSVEEVVDCRFPDIQQVQTASAYGLTRSVALRAVMEQDPDVIMLDKLDDPETARLAAKAALAGHLVLSSLPALSALDAVIHLLEMGVEPYLVASALNGVLSQRLVRCICPDCKERHYPSADDTPRLSQAVLTNAELTFYQGRGCEKCRGTGYRGRTGIHELFQMSERVRSMILAAPCPALPAHIKCELRAAATEEGMQSLHDDLLLKTLDGVTSLEEYWRILKDA